MPIEGSSAEVAGLRLVAESLGGRRNRIDTLLVCKAPDRSPDGEGTDEPPATGGATRYEEPAPVEG